MVNYKRFYHFYVLNKDILYYCQLSLRPNTSMKYMNYMTAQWTDFDIQLLISYHIIVIGCTRNLFLSGEGTSHIYLFIFIHFTFVYMLNAICITTNQLEHIQTNLCIHLSYLEDQRNLKIYNKNIKKKKKKVKEKDVCIR